MEPLVHSLVDGAFFESEVVDLDATLVFLPIRHHSPACAWHVRSWIREHSPRAVLIEGPSDANPLLEELVDARTEPPVALYGFVRASANRRAHACWYPFCSHSPEYVAIVEGFHGGADVAFIDIPTWWHASLSESHEGENDATNSYADGQIRFHHLTAELCRRTGSRDFDELWDRLFEAGGFDRPAEQFWSDIATYCAMVRAHSHPADGSKDGTLEREAYMAHRIQEYFADGAPSDRPVLVLTGGFHRGGLMALLSGKVSAPTPAATPKAVDRGVYLCPYGDRQLDRWSGYQSGMPAPAFYRSAWESAFQEDGDHRISSLLGSLGRFLRRRGERVNTADLIAAERMLRGLKQFRGHARPAREDLRDAVRATWIKGSVDEAHGHMLALMDQFLVGSKTGTVTPAAGSPPLVHDFEARVKQLRLPNRQALEEDPGAARAGRQINLDIHKRPKHRDRSAFLHQLRELEIPYVKWIAGPDFAGGSDLERVREIWQVRWRPEVLGVLVERALLGATIADAAQQHLLERFHAQTTQGAGETVSFLTSALVMGLPNLAEEFVEAVRIGIANDGEFASVARAFSGLVHLVAYRSILAADRFAIIAELTCLAYRQAVWLLDTLPGLKDSPADRPSERALQGLSLVRHAVLSQVIPGLDADLFHDALQRVRHRLGSLPMLEGAVMGTLRQGNRVTDEEVEKSLRASVQNTLAGPDSPLGDFLKGLFAMNRHSVIEKSEVLAQISHCVAELAPDRFLAALPSLRLAFTNFSPSEIRSLSETIETWVAQPSEVERNPRRSEADDARTARIQARVVKALDFLGEGSN